MMKHLAALAALAIGLSPAFALAVDRGGGMRGGGFSRPAAPSRPSGGGFDLNRDTRPPAQSRPPAQRPPNNPPNRNVNNNPPNRNVNNNQPNRNVNNNQPNRNVNNNQPNRNVNNNNSGNRTNVNVSGNTVNRTVINNPVYVNNGAWGWNHGVVWAPAPYYWGGGFWGAMAIGVTSAAVFGAVVNSANNVTYTSYQVQPNSPGATMLSNYNLTQTQCGPPNLVVIYGPSNSVICAYPNNLVSAGSYNLNTETLSLTSA